jgi:integrase
MYSEMYNQNLELKFIQSLGIKKRGHDLISNFCGWDALKSYTEKAPDKTAALFATLFESGARVTEAINLDSRQFQYRTIDDRDYIVIEDARVLKKKASAPAIKKRRNIPIPISEPLVPVMMKWVDSHDGPLFPFTRAWAWQLIMKNDPSWWPHRCRTERASQLVRDHGFDVAFLMRWFNWDKADEAMGYVRLGVEDLAKKMV